MPDCCDKAVEAEQTRWQERFDYLADEYKVDGGGCDSGDPLDFTAAEVAQSLGKLEDANTELRSELNVVKARVERFNAMFSDIKRFSIPTIEDGENAVLIIKSAVARAEKAEDLKNRYKAAFRRWIVFCIDWRKKAERWETENAALTQELAAVKAENERMREALKDSPGCVCEAGEHSHSAYCLDWMARREAALTPLKPSEKSEIHDGCSPGCRCKKPCPTPTMPGVPQEKGCKGGLPPNGRLLMNNTPKDTEAGT